MGATAVARRRAPGGADLPVVLGALTGGLLSSSCCVIQLLLNYLSVGCAGLSVFKPYRHLLRLLTAGLLGLLLARNGVGRRTLGTAVCSLLLTFSEDAVSAINRHGSVKLMLQRAGLLRGAAAAAHGAAGPAPGAPAAVRWRVEVGGMRCQACAARVRGSVAALPGVRNATVELAEGRVEVWADAAGGVDGRALAAAIGALDDAYDVRVAVRECFSEAGRPAACGGEGGDSSGGGGGGEGEGGVAGHQEPRLRGRGPGPECGAAEGPSAGAQAPQAQQQRERRRPGPSSSHEEL